MEPTQRESIDFTEGNDSGLGLPRIVVVGCGGAGSNTINRLTRSGLDRALTVAVNTDSQHLEGILADKKILIGQKITRGMGAGGNPSVGREAALLALPEFEDLFFGSDLVFITAGMGGGTGTGSAPVIAKAAKERGAIVVAMVTTPFHLEKARVLTAEEGLELLRDQADTTIVMDNNRLLEAASHLPVQQAFAVVDDMIVDIIRGLCDTLTQSSLINLDYADVRTIMKTGGASFMFVGETSSKNSPEKIVRSALKNPFLDVEWRGAKACLLHLSGGPDMTMKEAAAISSIVTQELDSSANVIWGAKISPSLSGKVRIMAIITGVKSAQVISPKKPNENKILNKIDVIR